MKKIIIISSEWNKVKDLFFDKKGMLVPEISDIKTGWNGPFIVSIKKDFDIFLGLIESKIPKGYIIPQH